MNTQEGKGCNEAVKESSVNNPDLTTQLVNSQAEHLVSGRSVGGPGDGEDQGNEHHLILT